MVINPISADPITPEAIIPTAQVSPVSPIAPLVQPNLVPIPSPKKKTYTLFIMAFIAIALVVVVGIVSAVLLKKSDPTISNSIGWKYISAGGGSTCGIYSNDKAYCWGDNYSGVLGDGTRNSNYTKPVAVDDSGVLKGKTIKSIAVGYGVCAIASDDNAYCWGDNGVLGNGSTQDSSVPVAVSKTGALNGKTLKQITVGEYFACAIASDDQVYCWSGGNTPTAVAMNGRVVTAVSAGTSHTCALDSINEVYCWGNNLAPAKVNMPQSVAGKSIKSIIAKHNSTCVTTSEGKAYCWGQLGGISAQYISTPIEVGNTGKMSGLTIKYIGMGDGNYCSIASDNNAYCWGETTWGLLGDNNKGNGNTAVAVVTSGELKNKTINSMAVDYDHVCVIASDSQVYCWGRNVKGMYYNNAVPVAVKAPF